MALDSVNPAYAAMLPEWQQLRDFVKGERVVKAKGETYLPATSGMNLDGMGVGGVGRKAYDAYVLRAVFPEYLSDALQIFMGMLHNKHAVIELPPELEPLRNKCTELGEPMELFLQRINLEQLTTGRVGVLLDFPKNPDPVAPMPFLALYIAEAVRNWDTGDATVENAKLRLVVLDESGLTLTSDFTWTTTSKYRVLQLGKDDGLYYQGEFISQGGVPVYNETAMQAPNFRGKTLNEFPFTFINTNDFNPDVDEPPLIGLARLCGAIYRGEADYRQNLFMQGQDTLVVVGERRATPLANNPLGAEEPLRTGAGARIDLDIEGDAKYIGVSGDGLSEQRSAIENDRKRAESRSGQLIDAAKGDKESGTALRTRVGAQTATLNQIAKTGALALETLLKTAARWMGADESKVKVSPNLEFADYQMSGQDLVNMMTAKREGAPISMQSIHEMMVQGNLTRMDFPTEFKLSQAEAEELRKLEEAAEARKAEREAALRPKGPTPGQGPAQKDPANPAPV